MTVRRRSVRRPPLPAILIAALAVFTGGLATAPASAAPVAGVRLIRGGLQRPLYVTHAGDARLFVVEQSGRIRILKRVKGSWRITSTFLDLRGKVAQSHPEQGLLGLAFHPGYAKNGRFYVDYTDRSGDTVIAEYRRARAGRADPATRRVVMRIHQPYANHNGGWIAFKGPYLHIALGDGGSGGDPMGNAHDRTRRLGKILRIDPLDPDGKGPKRFSIPADNPFVGAEGLDEIWALGLRNPWRASFDRLTGDLWIGDVGQDRYEEIDHVGDGKGHDFGWNKVEGRHLYPGGNACASECRTLPVIEYAHRVAGADNCSVVGGYVARRPGAALAGQYLYGDTCSGRIWAVPADDATPSPGAALSSGLYLTSFGEGADGTIYATSISGGVYRVKGT